MGPWANLAPDISAIVPSRERKVRRTHEFQPLLSELFQVHLVGDVSDEIRLFSDPANEGCFVGGALLDDMAYLFLAELDISIYTTQSLGSGAQPTWVKRLRSTKSCNSGSI